MLRLLASIFLLLTAHLLSAGTIVNMDLTSLPGEPAIYTFLVDGVPLQLLCDDAQHGIDMDPYQATQNSLSDLTETLLNRNGDPDAYQDYQTIAILDLYALENPLDIGDAEQAIWSITQDRAARNPEADALLSWAQNQDPANYNLSNFVIFSTPAHQEETGFVAPEPSTWLMAIGGMSLLVWRASRRSRRRT